MIVEQPCRTFVHGGYAKDRKAAVVECVACPSWSRTVRGEKARDRAADVGREHERAKVST